MTKGAAAADLVQVEGGEASLYGQFCPVAMAAELLATRWTLVVLGEMLSGSTRFNEIRHGVPRMSSALLSKRLRDLERAGILTRRAGEYLLTPSGRDLAPIVQGLGRWALRWVDSDCSLANLDVRLLMWNMRRNLRVDPMPDRQIVVEFHFPELPAAGRPLLVDRRAWPGGGPLLPGSWPRDRFAGDRQSSRHDVGLDGYERIRNRTA